MITISDFLNHHFLFYLRKLLSLLKVLNFVSFFSQSLALSRYPIKKQINGINNMYGIGHR